MPRCAPVTKIYKPWRCNPCRRPCWAWWNLHESLWIWPWILDLPGMLGSHGRILMSFMMSFDVAKVYQCCRMPFEWIGVTIYTMAGAEVIDLGHIIREVPDNLPTGPVAGQSVNPLIERLWTCDPSILLGAQDSHHRHVIDPQCTTCSQELDIVMGHHGSFLFSLELERALERFFGGNLPFDISAHPAVRHTVARRLLDRMEADARQRQCWMWQVKHCETVGCWNMLEPSASPLDPLDSLLTSTILWDPGCEEMIRFAEMQKKTPAPKVKELSEAVRRFGSVWMIRFASPVFTSQYLKGQGLIQKLDTWYKYMEWASARVPPTPLLGGWAEGGWSISDPVTSQILVWNLVPFDSAGSNLSVPWTLQPLQPCQLIVLRRRIGLSLIFPIQW